MDMFLKKLTKISLVTLSTSILFFLFITTIERYIVGGLATSWGFPFTVYYDYYFSPGVEFYNPLIILVDILLIYSIFTIMGLLFYFLIKDKPTVEKRNYTLSVGILIVLIIVLSVGGNYLCNSIPPLSSLPPPDEYVYGSDVTFSQDDTKNTLTVTGLKRFNLKWNDTAIAVNGNTLTWNSDLKTWNCGNIEIIHSKYSEGSIDNIKTGDYIANCSGIITITYIPTEEEFGTWEFT